MRHAAVLPTQYSYSLLSLSVFFLSSTQFVHGSELHQFDSHNVARVEVVNTSGKVELHGIGSGRTEVIADKVKFGDQCRMTIENRESTLFVKVERSQAVVFGSNDACEVNFKLAVPKAAALNLVSGSGDLDIRQTTGNLDFTVGSGSVRVDGNVQNLDGKAGSGDVSIKGLTSGGRLKTGSGRIHLTYAIAPSFGELNIKSGSGNAEIAIPKDAKIKTSFMAGGGHLTNELGDTPDSHFHISMMAGSGNLHIIKQ